MDSLYIYGLNKAFKFKDLTLSEWLLHYININRMWEMCFVHIYLLQKGTQTVAISSNVFQFFHKKKKDIQMILQLPRCLSAKYNMSSKFMQFYVHAFQQGR